jgi:hypothetical protein
LILPWKSGRRRESLAEGREGNENEKEGKAMEKKSDTRFQIIGDPGINVMSF